MRFLSLFSGIEAASMAWTPLGWEPAAFSEIEPFPCSVLQHHYPHVPNLGDVTKITRQQVEALGRIDLVCGGFPCQDLSVAGKRKGLMNADGSPTRSGLFFDAMRIAEWTRARWTVLENVPGLFSSNGGRDFAAVVGEMAGCEFDVPPGGWENAGVAVGPLGLIEWITLDAQYVRVESHPRAVPQRRRRVFLVRDSGNWANRPPLFLERASLCGHPAPSREAGQVAPTIPSRSTAGGGLGTDFDCDGGVITMANGQGGEGFDASEDGTGRGTPLVPMFLHTNKGRPDGRRSAHTEMVSVKDIVETLTTDGHAQSAVAVPVAYGIRTANTSSNGHGISPELAHTLDRAQGQCVAFDTTHTLRSEGFDASEDGTGRGTPLVPVTTPTLTSNGDAHSGFRDEHGLVPVAFDTTQITSAANYSNPKPGDPCHPLAAGQHASAIAFPEFLSGTQCASSLEVSPSLGALNPTAVATQWAVRRLTPLECERLMGFPDGHTAIPHKGKPAADGPRYKALGNSWAVNVAAWVGQRIMEVDAICSRANPAA